MSERSHFQILKTLVSNPRLLAVSPSINFFLRGYMKRFKIRNSGGHQVIQSHLPPLNSGAFSRFVREHLVSRSAGASHAQIGLTNACPQNCGYCYNKGRSGRVMDTETIKGVIRDLKSLSVFWLGLTGGEPLLNKDIVSITAAAADGCAVKLFTTGAGLTREMAAGLRDAGLFSVSVSLDHWKEEVHDQRRRCPGAFREALRSIAIFKNAGGMDVGVSAVLFRKMIRSGEVEEFVEFLAGLGIDEAWLSETKPSAGAESDAEEIIHDEDRAKLMDLQDRWNRRGGMTVNYLGHFESGDHFGCNAGTKMIYVDAFGEVSPCVFIPMTFGNVQQRPLKDVYQDMRSHFKPDSACFINGNYRLMRPPAGGRLPLNREESAKVLGVVRFGPKSRFMRLYKERREYESGRV